MRQSNFIVWIPIPSKVGHQSIPFHDYYFSNVNYIIRVLRLKKPIALSPYVAAEWNQIGPFSCTLLNGNVCGMIDKGRNQTFVAWEPIKNYKVTRTPIIKKQTGTGIESDKYGPYRIHYYSDGSQMWIRS